MRKCELERQQEMAHVAKVQNDSYESDRRRALGLGKPAPPPELVRRKLKRNKWRWRSLRTRGQ